MNRPRYMAQLAPPYHGQQEETCAHCGSLRPISGKFYRLNAEDLCKECFRKEVDRLKGEAAIVKEENRERDLMDLWLDTIEGCVELKLRYKGNEYAQRQLQQAIDALKRAQSSSGE